MWPIIKKAVNSDLSTPLNTLINNVKSIVNNVNSIVNTVNTNVGSNADAADPEGSAHAKLGQLLFLDQLVQASNDLRAAADATNSNNSDDTLKKLKEIVVPVTGVIRVSVDIITSSYAGRTQYIAVNGVNVSGNIGNSSWWSTITMDIAVRKGDAVQIFMNPGASGSSSCRNFRIYYTDARTNQPIVTVDD
jgi:hypothetical protein